MDALSYKTVSANKATVEKRWLVIDAKDQILGRLASRVAIVLRGKHKASYTPHVDCGDNIVIINADQVVLSGNKESQKVYTRHTGYPGGQRFATPEELRSQDKSERVIEHAVRKMLPRTRLGRQVLGNLYVYAGAEHPHAGQQPQEFNINTIK